jgi:hypothetical protein
MQTVVRGERRLKRRILRKIYKEKIANLIKKILGKKPDKDNWPKQDNLK